MWDDLVKEFITLQLDKNIIYSIKSSEILFPKLS